VALLPPTLRPGDSVPWFTLSALQLGLWVLQHRVARLSFRQLLNDSTSVLGASFMACFVAPISVLWLLYQSVAPSLSTSQASRRRTPRPVPASNVHPTSSTLHHGVSTPEQPSESSGQPMETSPSQSQMATIPLLHKDKRIEAVLNVSIEPDPQQREGLIYQLNLDYKGTPLKTDWHPTLEHAYASLCESLAEFSIVPITCGSCAYLYYPPQFQNVRELEQGLPQHAMCLFNQQGNPPNVNLHPALHVLSKACQHHTDKHQHLAVLGQWKESLQHEKTPLL
jgi:hypothetical protein